jgi:hypothetical protein
VHYHRQVLSEQPHLKCIVSFCFFSKTVQNKTLLLLLLLIHSYYKKIIFEMFSDDYKDRTPKDKDNDLMCKVKVKEKDESHKD